MNRLICYTLTISSFILLFSNCEEENTPANPANPANPPNYFIQDCDTAQVIMYFTGTTFFKNEDGTYFNVDGHQDWNTDFSSLPITYVPMCSQYLNEPAVIAAGLTLFDILENTYVPREYGSKAKLDFDAANLANPTLEIHLTNGSSEMTGMKRDDAFHINIDIENILTSVNKTLEYLEKIEDMKDFDWNLVTVLIKK